MTKQFLWHPQVHKIFGEKAYFILIRYEVSSRILQKDIREALFAAGMKFHSVFETFGKWDLIIRVWSEQGRIGRLHQELKDRKHAIKVFKTIRIDDVNYFWAKSSPNNYIVDYCNESQLTSKDILTAQDGNHKEHEAINEEFWKQGLIISEFEHNEEAFKFYIRFALQESERYGKKTQSRLHTYLKRQRQVARVTLNESEQYRDLIVKGEAVSAKKLNTFLSRTMEILIDTAPSTTTLIVADVQGACSDFINPDIARRNVDLQCLKRYFPKIDFNRIDPRDEIMLQFICHKLEESGVLAMDVNCYFEKLIRAQVNNALDPLEEFEGLPRKTEQVFRAKIGSLCKKLYGEKWRNDLARLRKARSVKNKQSRFALGDFMVILSEIILETRVVNIDDWGDDHSGFRSMMEKWANIRNHIYHGGTSHPLLSWENTYEFFMRFLKVYYPLMEVFDQLEELPLTDDKNIS